MNRLLLLILLFLNGFVATSQIIPADNRIDWTPGLPDGIPNTSSWITRNVVADFGADNSGMSNTLEVIQSGIDNLSNTSNYIIYFPIGTYRLEGSLILRSNIVLRGENKIDTKLEIYNPTASSGISCIHYDYGSWQLLSASSGFEKGAITLTVPDVSLFTVGEFAELQQTNTEIMTDWQGAPPPDWGQDVVGQMFEIVAINGSSITFNTPLHFEYDINLSPKIRPMGLIKNIGIENLYITLKTDTDVTLISFINTAYCWVKDIVSYKTRKAHIAFSRSLGCEVRGSQFSHSYNYNGGGHGYGVAIGYHTTDVLVENNSFDHLRHSMLFQLGSNGNVYGYNYSQRVHGEDDINHFVYYPADISAHGLYAYMNLFEGNSVQDISNSDAWGPIGPGNTYLRNRVESNQTVDGFSYNDANTLTNVIGNKFITLRDVHGLSHNNIEHGNVIGDVEIWNPEINDNNIPDSYYLTEKPAFFGNKPWPLYGPNIGYSEQLPAEESFTIYYESNKDELVKIRGPRLISLGQQVTVSVDYSASQDRKLHIVLSDGQGVVQAGYFGDQAIVVESGNGTVNVELVVPTNLSSAGLYSVFLTEINGPEPFWANGNYIWKLNQYDVNLADPGLEYAVELNLSTMLEGNFEESQQMMKDNLRQLGLLPLMEPYTTLSFQQITGGGESTSQPVLNITGNNAIVDWVLIELRDPSDPSAILATQSALLQRDGDIVGVDGVSPLTFTGLAFSSAYVTIRHRNHFGIRSEVPYPMNNTINLDFSMTSTGVYGQNSMNEIGGKRVMISGDANRDGQVNTTDLLNHWRLENGEPYNYSLHWSDFNLDGTINSVDKSSYFRPNNSKVEQIE